LKEVRGGAERAEDAEGEELKGLQGLEGLNEGNREWSRAGKRTR
jgi:hypothetical protein